ncbi:MAG TPA: Uma2 family endonuclease [Abditibacterium sp.]|jgi:Uma2 family endonuclease
MPTLIAEPLVEELLGFDGKAEIVNGGIQKLMPAGDEPSNAAGEIFFALRQWIRENGQGRAVGDNAGFLCDLPHRKSFSPDAAFYTGPTGGMKFFPEPPVFAVEVRSENDYGRRAEIAITQKIADYFAAGTLVVWDVDLQNEEVVAKYTPQNPLEPQIFRGGEIADAGDAVAGWSMPVDALFAPTSARYLKTKRKTPPEVSGGVFCFIQKSVFAISSRKGTESRSTSK